MLNLVFGLSIVTADVIASVVGVEFEVDGRVVTLLIDVVVISIIIGEHSDELVGRVPGTEQLNLPVMKRTDA